MQQNIENEPSYVFHIREFKENSVIASVLTLNYGRISVMLRGQSAISVLQPFVPLKLSLNPSKTDLFFLRDYEICGDAYSFKLPVFFCATYLNELLYHLYHSKDGNPLLFGTYVATLEALKQQQGIESSLRVFELTLLDCLGYGLSPLDQLGRPLQPKQLYRFGIGMGFIEVSAPEKSNSSKQEFLRKIANIQSEPASSDGTAEPSTVTAPAPQASSLSSQSTAPAGDDSQGSSVSQWTDEELESAMRFSKHKVKGRRLEPSSVSSHLGYGQGQYSGLVTPEGRPIGLSELLGPAMSGAVLAKIVAHKFDQDTLKQSKDLTNALFQFLLGKREIKSRQLYKEYLQVQASKRAAAQQAQSGAVEATTTTTTEQTSDLPSQRDDSAESLVPAPALSPTQKETVTAPAPAAPLVLGEEIEPSDSLVAAGAKATAALQEQQSAEKKAKRQRKSTKSKAEAGSATTTTTTTTNQPKQSRRKTPLLGEVRLEPSEALLQSEAKANAALQEKQAEQSSKGKRKRKAAAKSESEESTAKTEPSESQVQN